MHLNENVQGQKESDERCEYRNGNGRRADDATTTTLLDHVFGCILVAQESAPNVDAKYPIELLRSG
jgi:hypothetical protein